MPYSRYYRYKLSADQKKLYDELFAGLKDRRPSIRTHTIRERNHHKVLYALDYDNPELYYVNFSEVQIVETPQYFEFSFTYYCDYSTQAMLDKHLKNVMAQIIKKTAAQDPDASALAIHDWLVSTCAYGECNQFPKASYSIIGPLLYSKCVCEGYAKAYKFLADEMKIRCTVVSGNGKSPEGNNEPHAWNIVGINNKFYHVDVAYDSYIESRYCSRAYYLLSTKEILFDHSFDGTFELPECLESGSILPRVSDISELVAFLRNEYRKRATHSEVWLYQGFTLDKLIEKIEGHLSVVDFVWFNRIAAYWYNDYSKTLFVSWR